MCKEIPKGKAASSILISHHKSIAGVEKGSFLGDQGGS